MFKNALRRLKNRIKCKEFYDHTRRTIDFGLEAKASPVNLAHFRIGTEIIEKVNGHLRILDQRQYRECIKLKIRKKTTDDPEYQDHIKQCKNMEIYINLLQHAEITMAYNKEKSNELICKALDGLEKTELAYIGMDEVIRESEKKGISEQIRPYDQVDLTKEERKRHQEKIQELNKYEIEIKGADEESIYSRKQLLQLASIAFYTESYKESLDLYDKILTNESENFMALVNSGSVLFHLEGKLQESETRLNKARNLYLNYSRDQKQKHQETYGLCLQWLGIVKRSQGYYDVARDLHNEALKISKEVKNRQLEAHANANLGAVVLWENKLFSPSEVNEYWEQSLDISKKIRDAYWEVHYGIDVGYMKFLEGKYMPVEEHKKIYQKSLQILVDYTELAKDKGYKEHIARGSMNQASVHFVLDEDSDQTLRLFEEALEQATELKTTRLIWRINHNIGNIYRKSEEFPKAEDYYEKAIESIEKMIQGKMETEKKKFLDRRKEPFRSRLLLELDQDEKDKAVNIAVEYKNKFSLDFFGKTEEELDMEKVKLDTPNFINGYYILTE